MIIKLRSAWSPIKLPEEFECRVSSDLEFLCQFTLLGSINFTQKDWGLFLSQSLGGFSVFRG